MKKKKLLLIALLLVWVAPSFAAKVDTLLIKSPSMNKDVQVVVVTPDAALGKKAVACPAIYLLHGYGGNAKTWIGIKPNLPQIADEKGIIFVCPDGKNSCVAGKVEGLKIVAESTVFSCDCELLLRKYEKSIKE